MKTVRGFKLSQPEGTSLYPFQCKAILEQIDFLGKNRSCYNASEQGLGKTVQTCIVTNCIEAKKILIICPAGMRLTWEAEVKKWCILPYIVSPVLTGRKNWDKRSNVVIISYGLCEKFLEQLKQPWDLLVLDEAHMVKSLRAKRTKVILKEIWPEARYKIALSGTPITNNVVDGFSLFNRMAPDLFPRFDEFAGEYSYQRMTQWGVQYMGIRNADKLSKLIRERFFIRYTKEEVLPELPEKVFQKIILPASLAVKAPSTDEEKLKEAAKSFVAAVKGGGSPGVLPMALQTQRRLQGEKKVPDVVEFVENLLDQNLPVVLFAYHTNTINLFIEALKKHDPQIITGETKAQERFDRVKKFQDGGSNLFIGQMVAAGTGITLTRSSNVVLAEIDWSPAVVAQSCDRVHRIGQVNSVNVYYFVVKDSIDEDIVDTVMSKAKDIAKVIENPKTI